MEKPEKRISAHELQHYRIRNSENGVTHSSYRVEKETLDLIRTGNVEAVRRLMAGLDPTAPGGLAGHALGRGVGQMSNRPEKQAEYAAVVGVSLFARAAIEGGLDPYDAYDLNDLYLQRISALPPGGDYLPLILGALEQFTERVRAARLTGSASAHVRAARAYVGRNLTHPLSVQIVAGALGISPNYLSAQFCKSEGLRLSEYILRQRVEAAENLLRYSNVPIGQIAEYLCFRSQSHFAAVFKAHTGLTPTAYRSANQVEEL